MAEKDHAYEIMTRDDQIKRLEAEVGEKTAKVKSLEAKLDAAYAQPCDLVTETVESSGGLKVISTGSDGGSSKEKNLPLKKTQSRRVSGGFFLFRGI